VIALASEKLTGRKVGIIGSGAVGTTFAYSLLISGLTSQIVLVDVNKQRAEGEAMDLNHGVPFTSPTRIWAGEYSDCEDADIVVIAVDKGQRIKQSRLELASGNYALFKEIVPSIVKYNKDCILLVVTNPLDAMTYAAMKLSGFPKNKVIGSGTALDTARLRFLLGDYLKIDPRNVHAYIIGEHGDTEVPVWSLANVAGIRLKDYCPLCGVEYNIDEFSKLFLRVRNAGYDIIERKGRTNYAVALALTKIVQSILRDENAILTVSTFLEDYHGVSDVCLSVPVVLGKDGVREIIKLPLDQQEVSDFQKSAGIITSVIDSLMSRN
jgi:L-lactate dehydrogenase